MPATSIVPLCANNFPWRPWQSKQNAQCKNLQSSWCRSWFSAVTFNTPFGCYCYTRLPFQIASALEVFLNVMWHLFQDIECVKVIEGDLVVWDEDVEQHDAWSGVGSLSWERPQAKEREMPFSSIRSPLLQKFLKGLSKPGIPFRLTHFRGLIHSGKDRGPRPSHFGRRKWFFNTV